MRQGTNPTSPVTREGEYGPLNEEVYRSMPGGPSGSSTGPGAGARPADEPLMRDERRAATENPNDPYIQPVRFAVVDRDPKVSLRPLPDEAALYRG